MHTFQSSYTIGTKRMYRFIAANSHKFLEHVQTKFSYTMSVVLNLSLTNHIHFHLNSVIFIYFCVITTTKKYTVLELQYVPFKEHWRVSDMQMFTHKTLLKSRRTSLWLVLVFQWKRYILVNEKECLYFIYNNYVRQYFSKHQGLMPIFKPCMP